MQISTLKYPEKLFLTLVFGKDKIMASYTESDLPLFTFGNASFFQFHCK